MHGLTIAGMVALKPIELLWMSLHALLCNVIIIIAEAVCPLCGDVCVSSTIHIQEEGLIQGL